MTLVVALACRDGVVVAADGKVSRASTLGRGRAWQPASKVRPLDGVVVAGAGEHALLDVVQHAARDASDLDAAADAARRALVAARREAIDRYVAIYGDEGAHHAPRAYFLLAAAHPTPRILYMDEDGDIEEQTAFGYGVVGSGDVTVHVRLHDVPLPARTRREALVLAYGLLHDAIGSGRLPVSAPIHLWSVHAMGVDRLDDGAMDDVRQRHARWRQRTLDALGDP